MNANELNAIADRLDRIARDLEPVEDDCIDSIWRSLHDVIDDLRREALIATARAS